MQVGGSQDQGRLERRHLSPMTRAESIVLGMQTGAERNSDRFELQLPISTAYALKANLRVLGRHIVLVKPSRSEVAYAE